MGQLVSTPTTGNKSFFKNSSSTFVHALPRNVPFKVKKMLFGEKGKVVRERGNDTGSLWKSKIHFAFLVLTLLEKSTPHPTVSPAPNL